MNAWKCPSPWCSDVTTLHHPTNRPHPTIPFCHSGTADQSGTDRALQKDVTGQTEAGPGRRAENRGELRTEASLRLSGGGLQKLGLSGGSGRGTLGSAWVEVSGRGMGGRREIKPVTCLTGPVTQAVCHQPPELEQCLEVSQLNTASDAPHVRSVESAAPHRARRFLVATDIP